MSAGRDQVYAGSNHVCEGTGSLQVGMTCTGVEVYAGREQRPPRMKKKNVANWHSRRENYKINSKSIVKFMKVNTIYLQGADVIDELVPYDDGGGDGGLVSASQTLQYQANLNHSG